MCLFNTQTEQAIKNFLSIPFNEIFVFRCENRIQVKLSLDNVRVSEI